MGVYDRQRATALRLIEKYGEKVEWRQAGEVVNNDTPWLGGEAIVTAHAPYVLFITASSQVTHLIQALAGTTVPSGGQMGYMASVSFDPSLSDTIVRSNGSIFRIKSIDPLQPNSERPILYTLELDE